LIAGVRGPFVEAVARDSPKPSGRRKLSSPGDCSMGSQELQSSVAGKPYELGETGDTGLPADSEAKSWLKPSAGLKREAGEYSDANVLQAG
jgi:hypothetical protein